MGFFCRSRGSLHAVKILWWSGGTPCIKKYVSHGINFLSYKDLSTILLPYVALLRARFFFFDSLAIAIDGKILK